MFKDIHLFKPITLGKLRKIINNDLSEFPDDKEIKILYDIEYNKKPEYPICTIIINDNNINFYNNINYVEIRTNWSTLGNWKRCI